MKKSINKILAVILMVALLLCGCQAGDSNAEISEYYESLSKAQEIEAISASDSDITATLSEKKDIVDFVLALDMEHWEMNALPKTAEVVGTFSFSQEETIRFFEKTTTDGEMHSVCEMLCYEGIPYLTMKVVGLEMTFKVPDETADYLMAYFE